MRRENPNSEVVKTKAIHQLMSKRRSSPRLTRKSAIHEEYPPVLDLNRTKQRKSPDIQRSSPRLPTKCVNVVKKLALNDDSPSKRTLENGIDQPSKRIRVEDGSIPVEIDRFLSKIDSTKVRSLLHSTSSDAEVPLFEDDPSLVLTDSHEELFKRKKEIETRKSELVKAKKPLGKLEEPESLTQTTHHDFMMQEMQWMAADFVQERTWKKKRAKKLTRVVQTYHKTKANKAIKDARALEALRRKTAARIGRDVKKFWTKIDKIVAYKVQLEVEAARKKVMDKHLRFLIGQTEKYCAAMVSSFQSPEDSGQESDSKTPEEENTMSIKELGERRYSVEMMEPDEDSEEEFQPQSPQVDDETSIDMEERNTKPEDTADELSTLQKESTMSIEELRAQYADMNDESQPDSASEDGSEGEFEPESPDVDDETSIALEEKRMGGQDSKDEISDLHEESTMSIEELKKRYADMSENTMLDDVEESESDGEFKPKSPDLDDETSISQAEQQGNDEDEITLLEEEGTMSIEELRKRYAGMSENTMLDNVEESESDGEFKPESPDLDDETSISQAEQQGNDEDEITLLEEESTMSIEELRKRYAGMSENTMLDDAESSESEGTSIAQAEEHDSDENEVSVLEEESKMSVETPIESDMSVDEARSERIERPFLLHQQLKLREYQHVGMEWLASMYNRRMNGILADEMGLGKTIQTISLLAYLACNQGIWGPHLIVVPTSCLVNWEMEFKRWCPAFKVLSYYGSAKKRKELRQGWAKPNSFQICITSYQLVVQDAHCFRRKKWYFLILDEAHNIKNWKSKRWQTLLTFNSHRRLLLTGTPLQNNLMELWALMHFLMPHVFRSRKEFSYWFSTPLNSMVEGEEQVNNELVRRLHGVIRPFVLRRLKKDVEKQMPGKYEHVVMCKLSKRQRCLYEDFMSRSSTRTALTGGGNYLGMLNILMQLRKVCNHPDLFQARPIVTSFDFPSLDYSVPRLCQFDCFPELEQFNGLGTNKFAKQRIFEIQMPPTILMNVSEPQQSSKLGTNLPSDVIAFMKKQKAEEHEARVRLKRHLAYVNQLRCQRFDLIDDTLLRAVTLSSLNPAMDVAQQRHLPIIQADCLLSLVQSPDERIEKLMPRAEAIMCYVPAARVHARVHHEMKAPACVKPMLRHIHTVYYNSYKRTQLFFPDKRLVQFDCGKLQQLDVLLRQLKAGSHRCLIFTQMSSMLDILEGFLSLHGHSYFRLDGSTKVDQRQYLMDRFNKDDKIFCFILSTRSGGLGINLTGADSVIFYDSDWNPAMDAQAQDRAHRIGQTRDVHIYRLVSEHTVEENILKKAQQKKQLDFLVMSEGQFTTDFYSKANLRALVGVSSAVTTPDEEEDETDNNVEDAMAKLEDDADVEAMRGAKQELLNDQNEFNDENPMVNEDEVEDQEKKFEREQEQQLEKWKQSVSLTRFEDSLRPIERLALHFRQTIDPLFHYVPIADSTADEPKEIELEIEEIEAEKLAEEQLQLKQGDCIAVTGKIQDAELTYKRKRIAFHRERKRRQMTGEAWQQRIDVKSNYYFYYNTDTREAVWEKPLILAKNDEYVLSKSLGYSGFTPDLLLRIAAYLSPYPDRFHLPLVCKRYNISYLSLSRHIASSPDDFEEENEVYLDKALRHLPLTYGETIYLTKGTHRIHSTIEISVPICLIADPKTEIVLDDGEIQWKAKGGKLQGVSIRRSVETIANQRHMLSISGRVEMEGVKINSRHKGQACILISSGADVEMSSCTIEKAGKSGILNVGGELKLFDCIVRSNKECGVALVQGISVLRHNMIHHNQQFGIRVLSEAWANIQKNDLRENQSGALDIESNEYVILKSNQLL